MTCTHSPPCTPILHMENECTKSVRPAQESQARGQLARQPLRAPLPLPAPAARSPLPAEAAPRGHRPAGAGTPGRPSRRAGPTLPPSGSSALGLPGHHPPGRAAAAAAAAAALSAQARLRERPSRMRHLEWGRWGPKAARTPALHPAHIRFRSGFSWTLLKPGALLGDPFSLWPFAQDLRTPPFPPFPARERPRQP